MRRLTLAVVAFTALALAGRTVRAQGGPTIAPAGSTLRLTIVDSPIPAHPADNGRITLLRADSTFVWVSGLSHGRTDSIAYGALARVELRQRSYSRPAALTASALGTAVMAAFSVVSIRELGIRVRPGLERDAARGGFALGAAIGLFISRERWRVVTPPLLVGNPGAQ